MKNKRIYIRLSEEELEKIKKKAEQLGMSLSQYIRITALKGIKIESQ